MFLPILKLRFTGFGLGEVVVIGMTIAEIRKRRKRLCLLVLDDELTAEIDIRTFEESPYRVGSSISDMQLAELVEQSELRRMWERALYLLSLRPHAAAELRKKLYTGPKCHGQIDATIERLEELGLIRDDDYAAGLVRDLVVRKGYSRRRALQELCFRGINRTVAENAVDDMEIDDVAQAVRRLHRKYSGRMEDEDDRRKVVAALYRAGFDGRDIRKAFCAYDADEDDEGTDVYDG